EFRFFQQRRDATGRDGLSPLQKCTAAIRLLAYGSAADSVDEYLRLGESTALSCLENFTEGIIRLFGDEYLRRPTPEDLQRLLDIGEKRGFPGMVGSIDCMHWEWKNCPTEWKGQYTCGSGKPTIVLEAVASQDLWIWHAFFGPSGTLNDLNVLDRSPVFYDILEGRAPRVRYVVNGNQYDLAYYLTDGYEELISRYLRGVVATSLHGILTWSLRRIALLRLYDEIYSSLSYDELARKYVLRRTSNEQTRFLAISS
uniref:DDE Tnp4 domain-containing protein n=1 Tax=Brassica oleracea var. oleracea TaxID=109376 RepID=A0A0D3BT01_BRAOL